MSNKHLSTQFDADLHSLSSKVLHMGSLVESQVSNAIQALTTFDATLIDHIIAVEQQLNLIEVEIDAECNNIIARRQPTARDLRLVMAISKTITNLERAGDEAEKIAKCTQRIMATGLANSINCAEIKLAGNMANSLLRRALDAFTQLDTDAAAAVMRDDHAIDEEFRAFVRKLIAYMMENTQVISVAMDFLFIAKAIERIGDHAKNIAEFVIYIVKGTDIRHTNTQKAGSYDV